MMKFLEEHIEIIRLLLFIVFMAFYTPDPGLGEEYKWGMLIGFIFVFLLYKNIIPHFFGYFIGLSFLLGVLLDRPVGTFFFGFFCAFGILFLLGIISNNISGKGIDWDDSLDMDP